jgi:hypothetical protein
MNLELPLLITIRSHGRTFTAELPWDADMDQIAEALRGLLVAASWPVDVVNQYITTE